MEARAGGSIQMILIAAAAGEPMRCVQRAELVAGLGIVGDRYYSGNGHWSDPRWPDQELTLVEAEVAARLGLAPESLRRNLVTEGCDLQGLIGKTFLIGDGGVRLQGVRACDPCAYIEGFTRPGAARELAEGRGGLRAKVLTGGLIRAGDAVRLLDS